MSNTQQNLSEDIHSIFTSLTRGGDESLWRSAEQIAGEQEPRDHWLQTDKLPYEARLFLSAATAFSLRCLKDNPYKCAVLTRDMAETLAHSKA